MLDPSEYASYMPKPPVRHYHGDIVRNLFLIGGVVILISLPFFRNLLPIGAWFLTTFVVLLGLGAAILNPFQRWIVVSNTVIAAIGVILFEYTAVVWYEYDSFILSALRQLLAIIFLFALYFSGKTLRAMLLHQIGKDNGLGR